MQFRPPSQPGWGQSEPEQPQQEFPQQQTPSPFFQQLQPPTQPAWQEPQYPPRPETYYPPQQPLAPPPPPPLMPPPPKKRMHRNSKIALGIIISLVAVAVLIVLGATISYGASGTPSLSLADQQATATANAANVDATNAAFSATSVAASTTPQIGLTDTPVLVETVIPPTPTIVTTPTPQSDIGLTQTADVWSATLNSVKTGQGDGYLGPKAGNTYLYLNLTTKNTDTSNHLMSVIYFSLRDIDGNSYAIAIDSSVQELSGSVVAGQQLRGYVIYEVPKSIHSFTLQFDPSFNTSQIVQWQLIVQLLVVW